MQFVRKYEKEYSYFLNLYTKYLEKISFKILGLNPKLFDLRISLVCFLFLYY